MKIPSKIPSKIPLIHLKIPIQHWNLLFQPPPRDRLGSTSGSASGGSGSGICRKRAQRRRCDMAIPDATERCLDGDLSAVFSESSVVYMVDHGWHIDLFVYINI